MRTKRDQRQWGSCCVNKCELSNARTTLEMRIHVYLSQQGRRAHLFCIGICVLEFLSEAFHFTDAGCKTTARFDLIELAVEP